MDSGVNFDDLDIESSNMEDFKGSEQGVEDKSAFKKQTVLLDDGRRGYVFSFTEHNEEIHHSFCHVCQASLNAWSSFHLHISGRKHTLGMQKSNHSASNFSRFYGSETLWELEPGEPAPPGMEEFVTERCTIQPKLDAIKKPLLGLEYLFELTADNSVPSYCCLLCNKHGPENNIINHLSSLQHYMKFLQNFFPLTNSALMLVPKTSEYKKGTSVVVSRIAKKIEEKYERLKPKQHPLENFNAEKTELLKKLEKDNFREINEEDYINMVDWSEIKKLQFYNEDADAVKQKSEVNVTEEDNKDVKNKSLFNKVARINVEKRNLRKERESFDDDKSAAKSKSPDVILVSESKNISDIKKKTVSSGLDRKPSPISSVSSDSLKSDHIRKRYRSHSRSRSRSRSLSITRRGIRRRRRSKSRSRSVGRRHYGGSPIRRRYSRSPYRRYGRKSRSRSRSRNRTSRFRRDRSPALPYPRRQRTYSRSRSRSRPKNSPDRDYITKYKVIRKPSARSDEPVKCNQKEKLDKFVNQLKTVIFELDEKYKFYEKNPEKHPQYREEWKSFWNLRYKELQTEGQDPAKHDFKPEWITYWNKRLKELHEEQLKQEKESLKHQIGGIDNSKSNDDFPENSQQNEARKDVTVDDIKNTWKALTGSDIRESRSPPSSSVGESIAVIDSEGKYTDNYRARIASRPPGARLGFIPFDDNAPRVISVLRLISVLEGQIGSLGPKVMALLSKAIAMEKVMLNSSQEILSDPEHCVLFETVKEKLKGLLYAGLVDRNFVNTTKVTLRNIDDLIDSTPKIFKRDNRSLLMMSASVTEAPVAPVNVPGVGTVDRVAIAQQIAGALVAQGKTNVTEEELEQLINAVVGMAQAQATSSSSGPMTTAEYIQQQSQKNTAEISSERSEQNIGGLKLLQTAYKEEKSTIEGHNLREEHEFQKARKCLDNLSSASDNDLKLLIEHFRELDPNEQIKLITYFKKLESIDPGRVLSLQKMADFKYLLGCEKNELSNNNTLMSDSLKSSVKIPETKTNDDCDDDDDDDDDDYSVEDVYIAASEKLRQQELTKERNMVGSTNPLNAVDTGDELSSNFNSSVKSTFVESKHVTGIDDKSETLQSSYNIGYRNSDVECSVGNYQSHFQQPNTASTSYNNQYTENRFHGNANVSSNSYAYNPSANISLQPFPRTVDGDNSFSREKNLPFSRTVEGDNSFSREKNLPFPRTVDGENSFSREKNLPFPRTLDGDNSFSREKNLPFPRTLDVDNSFSREKNLPFSMREDNVKYPTTNNQSQSHSHSDIHQYNRYRSNMSNRY